MITVNKTPLCRRGEHDKCPGLIPAPPENEFGGWICTCECHGDWKAIGDKKPPVAGSVASPETSREAANPGLVRPPWVYLAFIVAGLALEYAWRFPFVALAIGVPLGVLLMVAAVVMFVGATRAFRAAGTPVPGGEPTTAIVRTGPYRFSRNPIYVAFSLLHLGIALAVNSMWLVATLIAALAVMARVVIPREERYLEKKFGAEYLDYRNSVRRWL